MNDPSWAKFRKHEQRLKAMYEDPLLGGDLLLIGISLARWLDGIVPIARNEKGKYGWNDVLAGTLDPKFGWYASYKTPWEWARRTLERDIRRYEIQHGSWERPCSAPMIRRAGECGQRGSLTMYYTDPETGEKFPKHACSRHRDWLQKDSRVWRQMFPPDKCPIPAANTGGILRAHTPNVYWDDIYKSLDPNWVPPPENYALPKPTLRLVIDNTKEQEA